MNIIITALFDNLKEKYGLVGYLYGDASPWGSTLFDKSVEFRLGESSGLVGPFCNFIEIIGLHNQLWCMFHQPLWAVHSHKCSLEHTNHTNLERKICIDYFDPRLVEKIYEHIDKYCAFVVE